MKQARFMVELHKVREEMARMKKSEEEKLRRKIREEYKDLLVKRA